MKRTKKILVTLLCAVLLVTGTVAVTVAYLTSTTDVVTNTFTVGNVEIDLDEAKVNEYGELLNEDEEVYEEGNTLAARVKKNTYKLLPGHEYVKDPTVHVEIGSEESYVFMEVVIKNYSKVVEIYGEDFLPQNVVNGWDPEIWVSTEVVSKDADKDTATYIFCYYEKVEDTLTATEPLVLEPLFTEIFMADEFDYNDVNTLKAASIDVKAYAIQADGFDINDENDLAKMLEALGLD